MKNNSIKKIAAALAAICVGTAATVPVMVSAADITINSPSETITVANRSFAAYELFKVEEAASGYFITAGSMPASVYSYFQTKGVVTGDASEDNYAAIAEYLNELSEVQTVEFAREILAAVKNSITPVTASAADGATTVNFNDSLNAGYYVIAETTAANNHAISSVMLLNNKATQTVTLKADQPTIQKKIWDNYEGTEDTPAEGDTLVDYNNATIGDTVAYQIKSTVPDTKYYTEYYFKMTDTFCNGLSYDAGSVKVYIDGTELDATNYIVTALDPDNDEHIDQLLVKFGDMKNISETMQLKGKEIIVTYTVTVNDDAVIGTTGNVNAVDLTYSNDPNNSGDGITNNGGDIDEDKIPDDEDDDDDNDGKLDESDTDDDNDGTPDDEEDSDGDGTPDKDDTDDDGDGKDDDVDNDTPDDGSKTETPDDKVITYLTSIKIKKVDKDGKPLSGAEFKITGNGVQYIITTGTDGNVNVSTSAIDGTAANAAVAVDASGNLVFSGLGAGEYEIEETKAPTDYNKITEKIKVTVTYTDPANPPAEATGSEQCKWSYTAVGAETGTNYTTGEADTFAIQVENRKGTIFPGTGGIGTTIFVVVGLSMMAGAVVLFTIKKKVTTK